MALLISAGPFLLMMYHSVMYLMMTMPHPMMIAMSNLGLSATKSA
ncbi:MAG: hypothetical protein JWP37_2725 [Mucilaginibacter sp.]|nr:hypothetical protein [Mucilaginibacter sp.]